MIDASTALRLNGVSDCVCITRLPPTNEICPKGRSMIEPWMRTSPLTVVAALSSRFIRWPPLALIVEPTRKMLPAAFKVRLTG